MCLHTPSSALTLNFKPLTKENTPTHNPILPAGITYTFYHYPHIVSPLLLVTGKGLVGPGVFEKASVNFNVFLWRNNLGITLGVKIFDQKDIT